MNIYSFFQKDLFLFYECFIILITTVFFLFIFLKFIKKELIFNSESSIQNIHEGNTSRLGGLVLLIAYITLCIYLFFKSRERFN